MYKKFVKNFIVTVSVIFFTIIIGYISYMATVKVIQHTANQSLNSAEAVSSETSPETAVSSTSEPSEYTYYLARLNGDKIEIYACGSNSYDSTIIREKFMYSFPIYVSDIPDEDVSDLSRGIIFRTKEELASFEEDYNS